MSSPEDLRHITESTLHSLIADESLKFRILQKAASAEQMDKSRRKKLIPVFCTVLAVLLIAAVSLNSIQAVPASGPGVLNSFTAGGADAPSPLPEDFSPDSVLSVEMELRGKTTDPDQCNALAQLILHQSVPADLEDPVSCGKLIITTSEGTTYVYGISEPYLIDPNNQCWSCPAFFSEFNNMNK